MAKKKIVLTKKERIAALQANADKWKDYSKKHGSHLQARGQFNRQVLDEALAAKVKASEDQKSK